MRIENKLINSLASIGLLTATVLVSSSISANAACAIAQGEGTANNHSKAVRLAKRDARSKAGRNLPSNASYSEPMCAVADDFERGIATYHCSVDLSYCSAPKVQRPVNHHNNRNKDFFRHSKRHNFSFHNFKLNSRAKFRSHAYGRFHVGIGHRYSRRTQTCLNFNAYAQGRSYNQTEFLVGDALNKSLFDHVGYGLNSGVVKSQAPACYSNGHGVINCTMQARYCD